MEKEPASYCWAFHWTVVTVITLKTLDILLDLCAFAGARWPGFSVFDPRGHLCNERRDTPRCNSIVEDNHMNRTSNSQCPQICSHCVLNVTGFLDILRMFEGHKSWTHHMFPSQKRHGIPSADPARICWCRRGVSSVDVRNPNFWNWSLIFESRRWRSLSKGMDFQVFLLVDLTWWDSGFDGVDASEFFGCTFDHGSKLEL